MEKNVKLYLKTPDAELAGFVNTCLKVTIHHLRTKSQGPGIRQTGRKLSERRRQR